MPSNAPIFQGVDLNGDWPEQRAEFRFSPFYYYATDETASGYGRVQPNPFWNAQIALDPGIKSLIISLDKSATDLPKAPLDWRFGWHGRNQETGEVDHNIFSAPVMRFGEPAAPISFNRTINGSVYSLTASVVPRIEGPKTFYDLKINSDTVLPSSVMQQVLREIGVEYRRGADLPSHSESFDVTVRISADGASYLGSQAGQAGTVTVAYTNIPHVLHQAAFSRNVIGVALSQNGRTYIEDDLVGNPPEEWTAWMGSPSLSQFNLEVIHPTLGNVSESYQVSSLEVDGSNVFLILNSAIPEGSTVRVRYLDSSENDEVKSVLQSWHGIDVPSSDWVIASQFKGYSFKALSGAALGVSFYDGILDKYLSAEDEAEVQSDTPARVIAVSPASGEAQVIIVEFRPTVFFDNPSYRQNASLGTIQSYRYTNEVLQVELLTPGGRLFNIGDTFPVSELESASVTFKEKRIKGLIGASNSRTGEAEKTFEIAEAASRDGIPVPFSVRSIEVPFGSDSVVGSPFDDSLEGGWGDDTIDGGEGSNELHGGPGDDALTGDRRGRSGIDWNSASYREAGNAIAVRLGSADGQSPNGTVTGDSTVGTDTLINIDEVVGTDFNDTYTAHANWRGGQFRTYFPLLPGEITNPDTVLNSFVPGGGNDTITGNGYTRLGYWDARGGGITATFDASVPGKGVVNATAAGLGIDTFTGVNNIRGSSFNDVITGGPGNEVFSPRGGNDIVDGGAGIDVVEYNSSREGVKVDLKQTAPQVISLSEGTDTLLNIERVAGSDFNDDLRGNAGDNDLYGRGGDDYLHGREGTNWLEGGPGNDTLTGGTRGIGRTDWNMAGYSTRLGHGIAVTLGSADGLVTSGTVRAIGTPATNEVGVDTLLNIDSVRGTNRADTFVVHNNWRGGQFATFDFDALWGNTHTPWIVPQALTEIRGAGGNDTITGNNFTRITYRWDVASGTGITLNYTADGAGTVTGTDSAGQAFTHSFTGVPIVRSTQGNDLHRTTQGGNVALELQGGVDTVEGSASNVTLISYAWSETAVTVDLGKTAAQVVNTQGWSVALSNVRGLRGSDLADNLKGSAGNDWIGGGGGNDTIDGGGGFDTVTYGGLRSDYTLTLSGANLTVKDNRTGSFNDATDTLINVERIRFSDQDYLVSGGAPLAALSGKFYHWKSHALLSAVEVEAVPVSGSAGGGSAPKLFEFRNADLSGSTFKAEVWVNLGGAAVENLDLTIGLSGNPTVSLEVNSAIPSWTLLESIETVEGIKTVTVAGFAGGQSAALTGSVKLGEVTAVLGSGQAKIEAGFLSGEAGLAGLSPYSVTFGAFKDTTGSDGIYEIGSLPSGSVLIDAFKALGSGETTGTVISSSDALAALKIAVGRNPNLDNSTVSPYQFISADVNGSGTVTSSDALAILKMAVKRSDAPAREWIFVDEMKDMWNHQTGTFTTTRLSVPTPQQLDLVLDPALRAEANLVAMLKGDVNGSWTAPAASTFLPDSYFEALVAANPTVMDLAQFG